VIKIDKYKRKESTCLMANAIIGFMGNVEQLRVIKISYTCSNHSLGYLAVEVSFIIDFNVVRKQRMPEKIDLCIFCFYYPAFSIGGSSFNSTAYPNLLNSLFK